jgi:hypothetical protein
MYVRQLPWPGLHGSGIDPGTGAPHRDEPLHGPVELLSPAGMQLACGDVRTLVAASPQDVVQRGRPTAGRDCAQEGPEPHDILIPQMAFREIQRGDWECRILARVGCSSFGCLSPRSGPCPVTGSQFKGGSPTSHLRHLDLNLLGNQEGVVHINPEISHGTLDLAVPQQELDGPEIACSPIDHRGFSTP